LVIDVNLKIVDLGIHLVLDSITSVVVVDQSVREFFGGLISLDLDNIFAFFFRLVFFHLFDGLFIGQNEFHHELISTTLSILTFGVAGLNNEKGGVACRVVERQTGAESQTLIGLGVQVVLETGVGDGVVAF